MTKTEAAEIVANETLVFARAHNLAPSKDLVEARISELRVTAEPGTNMHTAAFNANWHTTLHLVRKWY